MGQGKALRVTLGDGQWTGTGGLARVGGKDAYTVAFLAWED